jgi:hypothetical protein
MGNNTIMRIQRKGILREDRGAKDHQAVSSKEEVALEEAVVGAMVEEQGDEEKLLEIPETTTL